MEKDADLLQLVEMMVEYLLHQQLVVVAQQLHQEDLRYLHIKQQLLFKQQLAED